MEYEQYNKEILGDQKEYMGRASICLDDHMMDEMIAECMADM